MDLRPLLGLLVATATPLTFAAAPLGSVGVDPVFSVDTCSNGGNRQQLECLSTHIDQLKIQLDGAYRDALAKLPEVDEQDRRGGRDQLRQSEAAWLQYKQTNCPLMGALQGGSSSWITHFAAICEAQEIQSRTRVLRRISEGTVASSAPH